MCRVNLVLILGSEFISIFIVFAPTVAFFWKLHGANQVQLISEQTAFSSTKPTVNPLWEIPLYFLEPKGETAIVFTMKQELSLFPVCLAIWETSSIA